MKEITPPMFTTAEECLQKMKQGGQFIKIKKGTSCGQRTFRLDDKIKNITWSPSKKKDKAFRKLFFPAVTQFHLSFI